MIMKRLPFILFALILAACGGKKMHTLPELIAHAGGGVDVPYSNSKKHLKNP